MQRFPFRGIASLGAGAGRIHSHVAAATQNALRAPIPLAAILR